MSKQESKFYIMKKFILTLLVVVVSLTASAQVYVGGNVGFWRNTDANRTSFTIAPEVGYNLSDKWALGIGIGYKYNYGGVGNVIDGEYGFDEWFEFDDEEGAGSKSHTLNVDPYARWNYVKFGPVSFFLDMGFGISLTKYKGGGDALVGWNLGVKPGLKVSLAKQIDFVAHLGFLGYRDADEGAPNYGEQGLGFDFDSDNVMFGVYYNF